MTAAFLMNCLLERGDEGRGRSRIYATDSGCSVKKEVLREGSSAGRGLLRDGEKSVKSRKQDDLILRVAKTASGTTMPPGGECGGPVESRHHR